MELKIRLGDFKATPEQKEIVNEIIDSGRITEGKYNKLFEEEFSKYIGTDYAVTCTNGTVGLMLVLEALKIIKGRPLNFLVPACTFPATLNAVILTGNKAVLCDVGEDLLIDIDENIIESKGIDGIIPVHLMGYPCNMEKIKKLAERYDLFILEDACEATGSSYNSKKVGSFGNAGVFSFYMSHVLGCGELSIITTNNKKLADLIRRLKNHGRVGSSLEFNHKFIGGNFKTTEFMTGIAYSSLKEVDILIKKRQDIALRYFSNIRNDNVMPFPFSNDCSYLGFPIKTKNKEYRNRLVDFLSEKGIESRKMFPCLLSQVAYNHLSFGEIKKFPKSKEIEDTCLYLPCHPYISEEQIEYIIGILNGF